MFKNIYIGFVIFIAIVLAGCALQTENASTLVPIETQGQKATPSPTVTLKLPTQSPTSTVTLTPVIIKECAKLASIELGPPVETENNFLLLRDGQAPYAPFLMNPANGKITKIASDNSIFDAYVSPDGYKLAYAIEDKVIIANPEGKIQKSILVVKNDFFFFWGWLDDEHIMITPHIPEITPDTPKEDRIAPLIILDISDGSRIEIKSAYPGIDNFNYLNWQFNRVVYDPSKNYAVYPGDDIITLFSLPEQKILASLPAITNRTEQPQWSPNGEYLAVAGKVTKNKGNQELFMLDKNGNITRLTHLTDQFDEGIGIGNSSWSPDNRKIAFWYDIGDSVEKRLAVYNFDTATVEDYCIIHNGVGYPVKPIWSPDSKLVLVNIKADDQSDYKILWVNTETHEGAVFKINATVAGWLVKP